MNSRLELKSWKREKKRRIESNTINYSLLFLKMSHRQLKRILNAPYYNVAPNASPECNTIAQYKVLSQFQILYIYSDIIYITSNAHVSCTTESHFPLSRICAFQMKLVHGSSSLFFQWPYTKIYKTFCIVGHAHFQLLYTVNLKNLQVLLGIKLFYWTPY